MKTTAAVLWATGEPWSVEEIELDAPGPGEVLVRVAASGLCHSDEHLVTGDLPFRLPIVGGHEGAGVVEEVGAAVEGLAPGDHVVFGFVPSCGQCPSCRAGHQNLCDLGAALPAGRQIADGTSRHRARGTDLGLMCLLGTFAHRSVVHQASCIRIDPEFPLDRACLLGCAVVTGWGSAVHAAAVEPGWTVVVVGAGGVGVNAVQGARHAGARHIVAVDPVELKREVALRLGATHTVDSLAAAARLVRRLTHGAMAEAVIMAMGVGDGALLARALALAAKRGCVVVTNIHPARETTATVGLAELTLMEKRIVGSLFGSGTPRVDIPRMLELARAGAIDLDALVTRTYALEQINEGYDDMRAGRIVRGVVLLDQE